MSYEVTTVADGWYTIEVKHPDNLLEEGSFNLMIIPETGDAISVTITASEMWVNANGNLFATKEAAEADEQADATEYTIYVYAPDWTDGEAVYIHTYGDIAFTNYQTTTMTADADGWYKISFETTLTLSEFHYMLHTSDDAIKTDTYVSLEGLEGTDIYVIFTTAGNGNVYASKAEAEAAYTTPVVPPVVDPIETQNLIVHYHGTGNISVHAYYYLDANNTANITEWETKPSMTADTEAGWLVATVTGAPKDLFDKYNNYTAMLVGVTGGDKYVTVNAAEVWITVTSPEDSTLKAYATKEEAEAAEHVHNFGESYVYKKDGVADPTYHWQVCSTCGEESAKEIHEYETNSNVCTKCGYEKPEATHQHIWSEDYDTSVEGFHTQTCTVEGCAETKTEAHQFAALSHICSVCDHNEDEGLVRIYVLVDTTKVSGSTYYIYAYKDTSQPFGGWPGTALTPENVDGWYSVTLETTTPATYNGYSLIINNNDGKQYDAPNISDLAADNTEFVVNAKFTISVYAPDVTGNSRTVKTDNSDWSKYFGGEDGLNLTKSGNWYKADIEVDRLLAEEITLNFAFGRAANNTFSVNIENFSALYFVFGLEGSYSSETDAMAAYNEANGITGDIQPVQGQRAIYIYAPDWETAGIHTYGGLTVGGWGEVDMFKSEHAGWFYYLVDDVAAFNLIMFNNAKDSERIEEYYSFDASEKTVYFDFTAENKKEYSSTEPDWTKYVPNA